MKKILYITSILLIEIMLNSCNDNFLELSPKSQLATVSTWNTKDDATMATIGIYTNMTDPSRSILPDRAIIRMDNYSDNSTDVFTFSDELRIGLGTQDASLAYFKNHWANAYRGIRLCNDVLGNIGRINADDAFKESITGEAKFMRAYYYQDLIKKFGAIPYYDYKPKVSEDNFQRMPVKDVLQKILGDLDVAINVLPVKWETQYSGRATKGAALALKTRVLLYHEKYSEAASTAKQLIDMGKYDLFPDFGGIWLTVNEGNQEVIWEQQFNKNIQGNNTDVFFNPKVMGGYTVLSPLQNFIDAFEATDGKIITESNVYNPKDPWTNRDPRLRYTVFFHGDKIGTKIYDVTGELGGIDKIGTGNATRTGYAVRKFFDPSVTVFGALASSRNYPILRYAEVLLNYAEAKIESNSIDQSVLDAINRVRARAYKTTMDNITGYPKITTTDQSKLREIIRRERRVELAFEGLRIYDIRRWKIAPVVMNGPVYGKNGYGDLFKVEDRKFNPARDYLFPIPSTEIDLTKMEQNPGY